MKTKNAAKANSMGVQSSRLMMYASIYCCGPQDLAALGHHVELIEIELSKNLPRHRAAKPSHDILPTPCYAGAIFTYIGTKNYLSSQTSLYFAIVNDENL